MKTIEINLVRDFTAAPGARFDWQGRFSGESFREKLIRPALREADDVIVDLDNALGLPPSFLDEAIGLLLAEDQKLLGHLHVILTDNKSARKIFSETLDERLGKGKAAEVFLDQK